MEIRPISRQLTGESALRRKTERRARIGQPRRRFNSYHAPRKSMMRRGVGCWNVSLEAASANGCRGRGTRRSVPGTSGDFAPNQSFPGSPATPELNCRHAPEWGSPPGPQGSVLRRWNGAIATFASCPDLAPGGLILINHLSPTPPAHNPMMDQDNRIAPASWREVRRVEPAG